MEYDKIKQLMEDMGNSKLSSIEIDFPDGTKISMQKEEKEIVKVVKTKEDMKETIVEPQEDNEEEKKEEGNIVKSPMVGTFYLKPAPTSAPYVEVGKQVKTGDTLCIIEAMKLMNEIESEFTGTIKEILVTDGQTVEYGTPLFVIK